MKKEVCLMCIVCFFLGYFVADVVSKCGFGREHLVTAEAQDIYLTGAEDVYLNDSRRSKKTQYRSGGGGLMQE